MTRLSGAAWIQTDLYLIVFFVLGGFFCWILVCGCLLEERTGVNCLSVWSASYLFQGHLDAWPRLFPGPLLRLTCLVPLGDGFRALWHVLY